MPTLNPQITDESTLTGVFAVDSFLPIGVEGDMDNDGDATINMPEMISTPQEAATAFGAASSLTKLVQFILGRGISSVTAIACDTSHDLTAREAAWEILADDPTLRIRLTDGILQSELAALADSCEDAEGIQNKQFMFGGLPAPTTKSGLETAAAAIASKRAVLVGPGFYDLNGVLRSGAYVAALAACEVAKNPDITDSLNDTDIAATAGIELEASTGLPKFRLRSNGGAPIDDFEDLLDAGVSPLKTSPTGLAAFTHLRTTWTTGDTFDALMTLLIKDEVFIGIRDTLRANAFLKTTDTTDNRARMVAVVNAWLNAHDNWVQPVALPNGTTGFGVTATPSADLEKVTISYFGQIVRGTNVIAINGTLTIPA